MLNVVLCAVFTWLLSIAAPSIARASSKTPEDAVRETTTHSALPYGFALKDSSSGAWVEQNGQRQYKRANGSIITNEWALIDGVLYHFDARGRLHTGWQYIDGAWYCFDDTGAVITNSWLDAGEGRLRYVGESGKAFASRHASQGGYFDAGGYYQSEVGPAYFGGEKSWYEVSGVDRDKLLASMEEKLESYVGTPYDSYPCSEPGKGMHCAGFVARALYDAGMSDLLTNGDNPPYSEYVNTYNLGAIYKEGVSSYDNENTWHTGGFVLWASNNDVRWLGYSSHEELVEGAQRGEFQRGDILLYTPSTPRLWYGLETDHVCVFWGDTDEFLIWESAPPANSIHECSAYGGSIIVFSSVDYLSN